MTGKTEKITTEDALVPVDGMNTDVVKVPKGGKIRHTSQILYKKGEHKKFVDLIVMMLSSNTLPYYAEFSTFMNYYESTNIPTCGVNITKKE